MNTLTTHSARKSEDQGCRFRRITSQGIRVVLEVTGRCNLNCRHCFACSEEYELDTAQLLAIISQLPQVNARKLILTGGEPMLRMDVDELIQAATSLGIGVDLNTNMSAFSPKRANQLWSAGLRELSVSIDGMQEYHDWFRRQPGDFERVIKGIRLAQSMGYSVDVHGVCTPGNVDQIGRVIDLCAQLKVSSYTVFAVVSLGRGVAALQGDAFSLRASDKEVLWEVIARKRVKYGGKIAIRTVDVFHHPDCHECTMGEQIIGITSTGELMPCLLAEYNPNSREQFPMHSLSEAVRHMRQRVLAEGKHLACSNTAYAHCTRKALA